MAHNGSDKWIDFSSLSIPPMSFASGGGARAQSMSVGVAYSGYNLTGVGSNQVATVSFTSADTAEAGQLIMRRSADGNDCLNIIFNLTTGHLTVSPIVGGTQSNVIDVPVTYNVGSPNVVVVSCVGTTCNVTLNGVAVGGAATIPANSNATFAFGQVAGTAGSVVYHEVKVVAG